MKVTNEVEVYEVNGTDTTGLKRPVVEVRSHWNRPRLVVLHIEGAEPVTVVASQLEAAIRNATNVPR